MKKLKLLVGVLLTSCLLFSVLLPSAASALTFDPSRIIDDSVFDNKSSMTAAQIDAFLNSFPSSCLSTSNGFTAPDPIGYNIDQGYIFGSNVSGGTAIAHAAQAYDLNPQVLLATLQKEQSLVTGGKGCYPNTPDASSATPCDLYGNGRIYNCTNACPFAYGGGCIPIAVGYGCPGRCDAAKEGFSNQIIRAAWLLKFSEQRAKGNINWAIVRGNWDNSDDLQTCYSGPMIKGNWQVCPSGGTSPYDGLYTPKDGTTIELKTGATAALYYYTPFLSGNQSFFNIFTGWFGSTQSVPIDCNSKVTGVTCVWSVLKTDGSQFLTSSKAERDNAITKYGWYYDGIAFYASPGQQTGTIPVHRLLDDNKHYYTVSQSEYDTLMASGNWIDEGIAFYVYPSTASGSASHKVYQLHNSSNNHDYWTTDENQKSFLLSSGYTLEPSTFSAFSGLVKLPLPATGRDNIYELKENTGFFYTTNLFELETVIKNGYPYDGVVTTASANNTGTAVYRLQHGGRHFYTSNASERDLAVSKYGYTYEGIGFYVDSSSDQIYRLDNTENGSYYYTINSDKVMALSNTSGWAYAGTLFYKSISPSPVYRFLNIYNNRHFYTIDINEAARITNKGWKYETVAFYADKSSGLPVYRLLLYDKHFYTTNPNERDIAVSKYGYVYEGVGLYVSQTVTDKPVYRLQGGNDEYFYTASSTEKDRAVSKYGYAYEGIGFYLPTK
jgi:hypothetical protein